MKIRAIITCFMASVISVQPAFADKSECFSIEGYVRIFPSEAGTCPLVIRNGHRFDVDYLFNYYGNPGGENATCFSGQLNDTFITIYGFDIPVKGSSESALLDGFPAVSPNAVSAIKIKRPRLLRGKIFTIDTIFPNVEFLEVVGGTWAYKEVEPYDEEDEEGSFLQINGNALFPDEDRGAPFVGEICLD